MFNKFLNYLVDNPKRFVIQLFILMRMSYLALKGRGSVSPQAEPWEEGRYNRSSRGGVGAPRYRGFP